LSNASGPEKMLVIIPGGKVPNERYAATAAAIQRAARPLRLWAVIPAVFQRLCIISCPARAACAPLRDAVDGALRAAEDQGWRRGLGSKDLWLAGHSLGGVCADTLFQAYAGDQGQPLPYAGLLVMGSYVDKDGAFDLTNYPAPVMTLNVELDGGLARPGKTAVWWRQYLDVAAAAGDANATARKPVVVLPKLNHSDFCPGFDVPGDLMAEVGQAEATETIGRVAAAFLVAQPSSGLPAAARAQAVAVLQEHVNWTRAFLAPYVEAQAWERNASGQGRVASPLCARVQHVVAGLSSVDDRRLMVADTFHEASTDLEHCHPNWTAAGGRLAVRSCSHADFYPDVANTGSITAASEVACKLLSSDRVAQQLNASAREAAVDCRRANQVAVQIAEALAAPSTLERYRRRGRGWCFLEDRPVFGQIGPVWVFASSLELEGNATCMSVSSPVLKTELDGAIFPGSHYCKVLSPARALDWMMTDSLKAADGTSARAASAAAPLAAAHAAAREHTLGAARAAVPRGAARAAAAAGSAVEVWT